MCSTPASSCSRRSGPTASFNPGSISPRFTFSGCSASPAVIGLILGPLAETQFRRALSISQGDLSVFVTQPISATFLAITVLLVVVPFVVRYRGRLRRKPA